MTTSAFRAKQKSVLYPGGLEGYGLFHSAACLNLPLKPLNRDILSPVVDPLLVKRNSQAAYGLRLGAHRRGGRGPVASRPFLLMTTALVGPGAVLFQTPAR